MAKKRGIGDDQQMLVDNTAEYTAEAPATLGAPDVAPIQLERVEWYDDRFYRTRVEGEYVYLPSVTTILSVVNKPFLSQWRGNIGNEEADSIVRKALERGSLIHDCAFTLINGGTLHWVNPDLRLDNENRKRLAHMEYLHNGKFKIVETNQENWLQIFRLSRWLKAVAPKVLLSESNIYEMEHGYAGTLDYLFRVRAGEYQVAGREPLQLEDGIYIMDIKTGKGFDESNYYMQIAAYRYAVEKLYGHKILGGLLVHLNAQTRSGIEGVQTYLRTAEELDKDFDDFLHTLSIWKRNNATTKPKIVELPISITL